MKKLLGLALLCGASIATATVTNSVFVDNNHQDYKVDQPATAGYTNAYLTALGYAGGLELAADDYAYDIAATLGNGTYAVGSRVDASFVAKVTAYDPTLALGVSIPIHMVSVLNVDYVGKSGSAAGINVSQGYAALENLIGSGGPANLAEGFTNRNNFEAHDSSTGDVTVLNGHQFDWVMHLTVTASSFGVTTGAHADTSGSGLSSPDINVIFTGVPELPSFAPIALGLVAFARRQRKKSN